MKTIFCITLVFYAAVSFAKESAEFADKVIREHGLSPEQANKLKPLLMGSEATRNIGTEDSNEIFGTNKAVHPASRQSCIDKVIRTGIIQPNRDYEAKCGAKWMAPVPGPDGSVELAKVCIDQFEFPDLPCEYPVVWAPAAFADKVCRAMNKRVCNSHEWEGGCAGKIEAGDPYLFHLGSRDQRRSVHNQQREQVWAFQSNPDVADRSSRELCAIYSPKDPDLDSRLQGRTSEFYSSIGKSPSCHQTKSDYTGCGSHTWPSGLKYLCASSLGVYDMHGNVAEVTNFPRSPAGIAHGNVTDHTERKGSFFVPRDGYPDDCRVRQPYEHFNVFATDKHSFYQEGFRCCKDVE